MPIPYTMLKHAMQFSRVTARTA